MNTVRHTRGKIKGKFAICTTRDLKNFLVFFNLVIPLYGISPEKTRDKNKDYLYYLFF